MTSRDDNESKCLPRRELRCRVGAVAALIAAYLSGQRGEGDTIVKARVALATLFSAALAGLAAGYAGSYLVPMPWPCLLGIGWAVMIANMDSMLVALMGERVGAGRWLVLGPRLPVVVLSGAVFVELLTLRVFQPEVSAHLASKHEELVAQERKAIDARHHAAEAAKDLTFSESMAHQEKALADLRAQVSTMDERRGQASREALQAVRDRRVHYYQDGTHYLDLSYSRAAHAEEQRLARESEKLRDELKPEFARARDEIERLRSENLTEEARIDRARQDDLAAVKSMQVTSGLVAQLISFEEICAANSSARWARILLGLLLMGVELVPTFSKLGERSESALIREKMHNLLQDTMQSDRLLERMSLWMEMKVHRHVDIYLKDVDAAMGVSGEVPMAQPERSDPPDQKSGADDRVRRHICTRAQSDQPGVISDGEHHVQ